MAQNFLSCDRDQDFLMAPSVREWLPEGHLAWCLLDVVGRLDLSGFFARYRDDGSGRPAHDPGMMVALLLYAYAVGERSSRRIERRCREDVAFRVIAANRAPDHTTIARFRAREAQRLADLFVQVLALCARAGMVRVGTVAIDGTKMRAAAARGANRSHEQMREEVDRILAEAAAVDAAEDERFGDAQGDELPAEMADPSSRRARLDRAIRELEEEHQARVEEHQAKLDRRAAHREQTGKNPRGRPPGDGPDAGELAESRRNVTDPDSRVMTSRGRYLQAYNAQAVVAEGQIIVAAQVTSEANDRAQLKPMLDAARANLAAIEFEGKIKAALADGDYWNSEQIAKLQAAKTTIVIPTEDRARNGPREKAPKQGPQADRINKILATPAGRRFYKRRAAIIEPVFGQTKHNRGIDCFQRRERQAVDAEWKLIAATHNLLKYIRHQPQIA
jgi:transposase